MYLLIDNYDSFTFNLYQQLRGLGVDVSVHYADQLDKVDDISSIEAVIISPGPGKPEAAHACLAFLRTLNGRLPLLGVCLGHQILATLYGGRVVQTACLMHGAQDEIMHDGSTLFRGVPHTFLAARYHSLCVEPASLPECLQVTAVNRDGMIMAITHRDLPVYGLQFHPESIMTLHGDLIMQRFIEQVEYKHVNAVA